jgi:hypothetical protein
MNGALAPYAAGAGPLTTKTALGLTEQTDGRLECTTVEAPVGQVRDRLPLLGQALLGEPGGRFAAFTARASEILAPSGKAHSSIERDGLRATVSGP